MVSLFELFFESFQLWFHDDDEILEYTTDPELIKEKYDHLVDMVVDGGYGNNEASTIVDCTSEEPEILRDGMGDASDLY